MKDIQKIAEEKAEYRLKRASLSFPEKIRILVKLQERRAPILAARGKTQRIWKLDG